MGVFSEDGNWEFVDGDWIPTEKQKQLAITLPKPPINSNPIKFVNQQLICNFVAAATTEDDYVAF